MGIIQKDYNKELDKFDSYHFYENDNIFNIINDNSDTIDSKIVKNGDYDDNMLNKIIVSMFFGALLLISEVNILTTFILTCSLFLFILIIYKNY